MGPRVGAVVRIDTSVPYSFRNHGRYSPDFTIVRCILCSEASNVKNVWVSQYYISPSFHISILAPKSFLSSQYQKFF